MEYNKDEGERCFKLAETSFEQGDREKALKLVKRSLDLYHSIEAEVLLDKIERLSPPLNGWAHGHEEQTPKQRKRNGFSTQSRSSFEYTKEQEEAVQRIKQCKNHYEVLGVDTEVTEHEIKKKYRKLALTFHPDKNQTPGAIDAFQAIGTAFAVLNDPDKRRQYDNRCGSNGYTHGYGATPDAQSDMTADEIFNMFFNSSHTYQSAGSDYSTAHTFRRHHQSSLGESAYALVMQVSPLLILMGFLLVIMLVVGDHPYSFHKSIKYCIERRTINLKVEYYVKKEFTETYDGSNLRRLERDIEMVYIDSLKEACQRENIYKKHLEYTEDDKASKLPTPNCDRLEELKGLS